MRPFCPAVFAAVLAVGVPAASASDFKRPLLRAYLSCEVAAQSGSLVGPSIAQCSAIYETLKRDVFDGSFPALRAWYEAEKASGYPLLYGGEAVVAAGA